MSRGSDSSISRRKHEACRINHSTAEPENDDNGSSFTHSSMASVSKESSSWSSHQMTWTNNSKSVVPLDENKFHHDEVDLQQQVELCPRESILSCLHESKNRLLSIPGPTQTKSEGVEVSSFPKGGEEQENENGNLDSSHVGHGGRRASSYVRKRKRYIKRFKFFTCLASYSVIGESLRICLTRLFGSECLKETTPWLHTLVTKYNSCVTSNIGALFVDLPANMLGCFVMGIMQSCKDLDVSDNPDGLAFLPDDHWFHSWKDTHYALRSGFCSSLTSFASWNTQMVTMIFGVGVTNENGISSRFISAIFGYIIGMELAVASFVLGRWTAVWFYRFSNPLIRPADDETVTHARLSNRTLPDIERQFLGCKLTPEDTDWVWTTFPCITYLERWRQSTEAVRSKERGNVFRPVFEKIEESILVHNTPISHDELTLASAMKWDVDALVRWNINKEAYHDEDMVHPWVEKKKHERIYVQRCLAIMPYMICVTIVCVFVWLDLTGVAEVAYRGMWMSAIAAPFGALVRCGFAFLNGKLPHPWQWFPFGTFISNMTGSLISISAVALSLNLPSDASQWHGLLLFAVKTGFAGSLSTVGTFVVEGHNLQVVQYPFHVRGLCYMGGSVVLACILSSLLFGVIYDPIKT